MQNIFHQTFGKCRLQHLRNIVLRKALGDWLGNVVGMFEATFDEHLAQNI
jgi:hypothetical protein